MLVAFVAVGPEAEHLSLVVDRSPAEVVVLAVVACS